MRHVVFNVGNERYGLPLSAVREVVVPTPMSKVPRAPAGMCGIMNLRGRVVSVVDLGTLLGIERGSPAEPDAKVVLLDRGRRDLGLLVRQVEGIHTVEAVSSAPGEASPAVRGVARLANGNALTVLDADGLERQIIGLFKPR